LASIVALVLRNSFLYEKQEQIIHERTGELRRANERLQAELAERRLAEARLLEQEAHLCEAQKIAQMGSWTHHLLTGERVCSRGTRWIFGWPEEMPLSEELYLRNIHSEDVAYGEDLVVRARRGQERF
jgi:hypothetical protein